MVQVWTGRFYEIQGDELFKREKIILLMIHKILRCKDFANIGKEYNLELGIFVFHNFIFTSESVNKIKCIVAVQHFATTLALKHKRSCHWMKFKPVTVNGTMVFACCHGLYA